MYPISTFGRLQDRFDLLRSVQSECDFVVLFENSVKFACRVHDGAPKPRVKAKGD